MRGVSVIMCCYNSEDRLQETLKHLARQKVPRGISWEIVLVDNASTDHTGNLAQEIWRQLLPASSTLRVIQETRPGQQLARIRGVQEARYEILVFCNDDNWLDPDYISQSEKTMWQNVRIAAAGGQNLPETNAEYYPAWFENYRDKYALGVPASHSGYVTQRGFVLGAGMVTRKSLFLEMYHDKFPSLLKGRKGENLSTGDDFEYCKRLLLRGWQLYYEENLKLVHFIPKERLTIDYRDKLMKGIEVAGLVLHEYDLAIRVHNRYKHKDRLRLLLLTPFRIIGVRMGLVNRVLIDEELTLYYLSPFASNKNPVRKKIKDFIYRRSFN
jgi:glycosyltransferase involved in cell wall biosynthesis